MQVVGDVAVLQGVSRLVDLETAAAEILELQVAFAQVPQASTAEHSWRCHRCSRGFHQFPDDGAEISSNTSVDLRLCRGSERGSQSAVRDCQPR